MNNMVQQVTKKEFGEIVDEAWKQIFATYEEKGEEQGNKFKAALFKQLFDEYAIMLPFEPETDNEVIKKIIARFCDDAERRDDFAKRSIFFGSVRQFDGDDYEIAYLLPKSFEYIGKWSTAYRHVWISEEDLCTVTTCEGDLSISFADDAEEFVKEIAHADEFYEEY